jgi:hypothetical protein|tara:strand:+ start:2320 stop:2583 length:264 start_codon:yes stop_codon:yes gene_type:complete
MRIKHNFTKISILQPERRFNENSNRNQLVNLINELLQNNQPLLLSELIANAEQKLGFSEKTVLAMVSKLRGCNYIVLTKIMEEKTNL